MYVCVVGYITCEIANMLHIGVFVIECVCVCMYTVCILYVYCYVCMCACKKGFPFHPTHRLDMNDTLFQKIILVIQKKYTLYCTFLYASYPNLIGLNIFCHTFS